MDKYESKDAVAFALAAKPVEFNNAVLDVLGTKVTKAVEDKREALARPFFNQAQDAHAALEAEEEEVETEAEVETPAEEEEEEA
jgi:hypothetical protein